MGMIKNRNCKDITDAEEIKKRWQEYIEELYKNWMLGAGALGRPRGMV